MSERKINLQYILSEKLGDESLSINEVLIESMKEACRQVLELAAENAEILRDDFNYDSQIWETEIVDKQSILDTIKQVE